MGENDFLLKAAPYIAEFFGTFTLVFTTEWATLTGAQVGWCITAVAAVLIVMIYACVPVSGGYFNPAASLALAICGRLEWNVCAGYCLAQVIGGVLAGCLCNVLLWRAVAQGLKPMLFDHFPWYYAGGAEAVYTCILVFVILNVSQTGWWYKNNEYYGLAVGMVVVAGGYAAAGISGACFNPALIIGFDLTLWNGSLKNSAIYCLWQVCGAVCGALLYKLVRPKGDEKDQLPLLSRIVGEFLGTYVIVLTVGFSLLTRSKAVPWAATGAVISMSYALYGCAGSFNPAVTLGIVLTGKWNNHWLESWTPSNHIISIVGQFAAGALAGAHVGLYCLARDDLPRWIQVEVGKFATAVEYPLYTSLTAEFFFTTVLTFVFLAIWTHDNGDVSTPSYFGLVIGLCITVGGFVAGPVSGGLLNPAVALGISVQGWVNSNYGWGHMDAMWITLFFYWTIAQFLGGCAGSGLYRLIYRETYTDKPKPAPLVDLSKDNKDNSKNDRSCNGCTLWGGNQNLH